MKLKILLFFALVCIFSAAAVPAQDKTTIALQDLVKQMVAAQGAFDVPALERLTTADYIEISPLGEFDPREKVLGFYKPELKPANIEVKNEVNELSVRNYAKFAVVIARLDYTITMGGKTAPPRSIRATYVCRKDEGMWKIASAHYTSIRPVALKQSK
jgi:ketosteroid isomerase-like protein